MIELDPEEAIASGCFEAMKRGALFVASIWIGSGIGVAVLGLSEGIARVASGVPLGEIFADAVASAPLLFMGPIFLFSLWLFLNVPLMISALVAFTRLDVKLPRWWIGLATLQIFMVVAGNAGELTAPVWLPWIFAPLAAAALCGCVWLGAAWLRQRWLRQIHALEAENAERRKAIEEQYGTREDVSEPED